MKAWTKDPDFQGVVKRRCVWHMGVMFVLITLTACVYQVEDEIYLNPIAPPDVSNAYIDLDSVRSPITIKRPATFRFSVNPRGKKYYDVKVTMDFGVVFSKTSAHNSFTFSLDPANFHEGARGMSVIVTYPTGSASLAGKLDAETITFRQDFTVVVEKLPPAPTPRVYIEDGKSMISWTAPIRDNYRELIIQRVGHNGTRNLVVPDKNALSFHDASYTGGRVSYRIMLKDDDLFSHGEAVFFDCTPLSVRLDSLASPYPMLSWDRSPLYNNNIAIAIQGEPLQPIDQAGQLAVPMNLGGLKTVWINVVPSSGSGTEAFVIQKEIYKGIRIDEFSSMHFYPQNNAYVFLGAGLWRVDANTWSKSEVVSGSGRLLVSEDYSQNYYLRSGTQLVKFDPVSLNEIESFNLRDIPGFPTEGGIERLGILANNGLLACEFHRDAVVVDLAARTVVWAAQWANLPTLSPDGDLLFHFGGVYSRTDGNWSAVDYVGAWSSEWSVTFRQNEKNQMFINTNEEILVYNLDELNGGPFEPESIAITSIGKESIYHPESNTIHLNRSVNGAEALYIYDADTFEEVRMSPEQSVSLQSKVFENGHFFHTHGFFLP